MLYVAINLPSCYNIVTSSSFFRGDIIFRTPVFGGLSNLTIFGIFLNIEIGLL
jgi:hypothetical protein